MNAARSEIETLCASLGIATGYHDIWGNWRRVPDASLLALLHEFGVDASTTERAANAECAMRAARWREVLAPVVAIACDRTPWNVRIRTPAEWRMLHWSVDEESGTHREGDFDAHSLRETGRGEIERTFFREGELAIGVALTAGYHRLRLWHGGSSVGEALIVAAPARCYRPQALENGGRVWGPMAQLYALRSERNWGIGDFSDLAQLVDTWATLGAGIVGVSPLHALFPHDPAQASPYSPSSRQRLNVLYIDVEAVAEFVECEEALHLVRTPEFQARLERLREAPLVDYAGVSAAKFEVLERLYAHFRSHHLALESPSSREFRAFQLRGGDGLRRHALLEALQEFIAAGKPATGDLPRPCEAYQGRDSATVARFAIEHADRVEYFEYLQWLAERQLANVGARCAARRLGVGLYLDLAVSVSLAGSDVWSDPADYARGASVGAPPDDFNPDGQDWGLPPLRPDRMRASGYARLRQVLAANMRAAGALRIDHVMGLMRLFWVPLAAKSAGGAYVHYALDEQLAIVALESHRSRCMVIGEDLGTVPDEVREKLAQIGVLSCRLLYFERHRSGLFKTNAAYPRDAIVAIGTHDLPTLAGWWEGRDLQLWRRLGLGADRAAHDRRAAERVHDRLRLAHALAYAGVLPDGRSPEELATQPFDDALAQAVQTFIAAAPSQIAMVQLEDVLGVVEQVNLPGTTTEYPNWRRKLPESVSRLPSDPRVLALAQRLSALRPPLAAHG